MTNTTSGAANHPSRLQRFIRWLSQNDRMSPQQLIWLDMIFSACGAYLLVHSQESIALIGCAVFVQLRLFCNLLENGIRSEKRLFSPRSDIWRHLTDRFCDSVLIVALGYAIDYIWAGWLAAFITLLSSYARVLLGYSGFADSSNRLHDTYPRLLLLSATCILGAVENHYMHTSFLLAMALALISLDSLWTFLRRICHLLKSLPS